MANCEELNNLIKNIDYKILCGNTETEIGAVRYDSRKVEKGDLFVCITGFQTDGHKYAESAVKKGAAAIVAEHEVEGIENSGVTVIITENTRKALAYISAAYYDHPSEKINVIGVTGTNGKTTTTYLIKTIYDSLGYKTGVVGTIGNMIGDKMLHADRTTPESLELQELLDKVSADQQVVEEAIESALESLEAIGELDSFGTMDLSELEDAEQYTIDGASSEEELDTFESENL